MASPFAIVPEADILGAITARLRLFTEITALVNTNISGELPEGFDGSYELLWLRRTGGPVTIDRRLIGQAFARIDITAFAPSARRANRLMAYTLAALCPPQGKPGSFTQSVTNAGTVRVYDVFPNAEPVSSREPDTSRRYSWVPVVADYSVINS